MCRSESSTTAFPRSTKTKPPQKASGAGKGLDTCFARGPSEHPTTSSARGASIQSRARRSDASRPVLSVEVEARLDQPQPPSHAMRTERLHVPLRIRHLLPAQGDRAGATARLRPARRAEDAVTQVIGVVDHGLVAAFRDLHASHLDPKLCLGPFVCVLLPPASRLLQASARFARVDV